MHPGQQVRLIVPENTRLHGALGEVVSLEKWGAHVQTAAAATGRFRAHWTEMETLEPPVPPAAKGELDGMPCDCCGSLSLRRCGSCLVCDNCGTSTGC